MGKTFRKGSKMNNFEETRDGRRTKPSKSCECNGGCPYCESDRLYQSNKNKMSKQDLKKYGHR